MHNVGVPFLHKTLDVSAVTADVRSATHRARRHRCSNAGRSLSMWDSAFVRHLSLGLSLFIFLHYIHERYIET